jgi:hypothetical protein
MAQLEMFNQAPPASVAPSAEQVRARLAAIFATLRGGDKVSWSELRRLQVVAPQMAQWLPAEERAAVLSEFEALARGQADAA